MVGALSLRRHVNELSRHGDSFSQTTFTVAQTLNRKKCSQRTRQQNCWTQWIYGLLGSFGAQFFERIHTFSIIIKQGVNFRRILNEQKIQVVAISRQKLLREQYYHGLHQCCACTTAYLPNHISTTVEKQQRQWCSSLKLNIGRREQQAKGRIGRKVIYM